MSLLGNILGQDYRELKTVVQLQIMYAPLGASYGGYYSSTTQAQDPQNLNTVNKNNETNNPTININGTNYQRLSPKIQLLQSFKNAHTLSVNTSNNASSCTFAFGGIVPGEVHPIYNLLAGPSTNYSPVFDPNDNPKTLSSAPNNTSNNSGIRLNDIPVIPFSTGTQFSSGKILTTYNIWQISNGTTSAVKYEGPKILGNQPSIKTIKDPNNGSSVEVSCLNASARVTRIFPVSKDAIYGQSALMFYPFTDATGNITYPKSRVVQAKSDQPNSGFYMRVVPSDMSDVKANFQINLFGNALDSKKYINGLQIFFKNNAKPEVKYTTPVGEKKVLQLNAPEFRSGNNSSYEIFVHFAGPNLLIGFDSDIKNWNTIAPQQSNSSNDVYECYFDSTTSISMDVANCNVKFSYSAICFNNFNSEYFDTNAENSDKSNILVEFRDNKQSNLETTTQTQIQTSLSNHRYLGDKIHNFRQFSKNVSYHGDWRSASDELSYLQIAENNSLQTLKIRYGQILFNTTIEGPIFLQLENQFASSNVSALNANTSFSANSTNSPSNLTNGDVTTPPLQLIYDIKYGDISPWVEKWTVACDSDNSNMSFVTKSATIELVNLDISIFGQNILDLIESNLIAVKIFAGYGEVLHPYFQGFIISVETTKKGNTTSTVLDCKDIASYTLDNIHFEKPMRISGMTHGSALDVMIQSAGFYDFYTRDNSIYGMDFRLNDNAANDQDLINISVQDNIKDKIDKILTKFNALPQDNLKNVYPVFRWDEVSEKFVITSRYNERYIDSDLKFIGQDIDTGMSTIDPTTIDWHGLLTGSFSIIVDNDVLAYSVTTFGETLQGFFALTSLEKFHEDALSQTKANQIINFFDPNNLFRAQTVPSYYTGFKKTIIDVPEVKLPDYKALAFKHAFNELKIRTVTHSINFDCLVTKPLNHHGTFVINALSSNLSTPSVTDIYVYESIRYTFNKANNKISAFVRAKNQPYMLGEIGGL
jgi:hypothetical protein